MNRHAAEARQLIDTAGAFAEGEAGRFALLTEAQMQATLALARVLSFAAGLVFGGLVLVAVAVWL